MERSEAKDAEIRRLRNCDGYTNENLIRDQFPAIGFIKRCPNALEPGCHRAFNWWWEYRESKILPFAGLDFAGQPAYVAQAIRLGEADYLKAKSKPGKTPPQKPPAGPQQAPLPRGKPRLPVIQKRPKQHQRRR